jgi:ferredoxin
MKQLERQHESFGAAVSMLEGRELLEEEALCLNIRGRAEHCQRCATVCHSNALSLTADAVEVDREKCTGCGACVPVCLAGALRLSGFSPRCFLEALAGETEVHLHCTESTDSGGGVVIPCFKVLDDRLLAAVRADGVETLFLHGLDRCVDCRHGGALRELGRMQLKLKKELGESAVRLLPATTRVTAAKEYRQTRQREDQPHLNRRSFLRFAGAHAASGAARWLVPVEVDDDGVPDLPFFQGDPEAIRQPHPYQSLLAERVGRVPWRDDTAVPWRKRSMAEHCNGCLACGQRCPTGALLAKEENQTRSISFEQALCTDCGLCEALCPVDAVLVHRISGIEEVEVPRSVLMMRMLVTCDHCGTDFLPETSDATTCPTCSNEQELDDEWLAMLEG